MKKSLVTKKEVLDFKKKFKSGSIKTNPLLNVLLKLDKRSIKKEHHNFLKYLKSALYLMPTSLTEKALTYHFGKYDFMFKGNHKYYNWVLDHNNIQLLVSSKNEIVGHKFDDKLSSETLNNLMSFLKELDRLVLEYYFSEESENKKSWSEYVDFMKKEGWIVRRKWQY